MKSFFLVLLFTAGTSLLAQTSAPPPSGFLQRWAARVTEIQSHQPGWAVPVVAPYPMLIQVFRTDVTRQVTPALTPTWNYSAARGLNLIPGLNSEIDIYPPSYLQHNSAARDGFGDVGFLYKYRILARNEKHGNYAISAQLVASVPTGTYTNGSRDASVSPTLLAGKGFGKFDVITSLGGTLPTGDSSTLGRTIAYNTTAQYKLAKYFVPEIEDNATWFYAGKSDGKMQNFLTPGMTAGKFKFYPKEPRSRVGATVGMGMQIATSGFHAYNHNLVFTGRLLF